MSMKQANSWEDEVTALRNAMTRPDILGELANMFFNVCLTGSVLVVVLEVVGKVGLLVLPVLNKLGHVQAELHLVNLINKYAQGLIYGKLVLLGHFFQVVLPCSGVCWNTSIYHTPMSQ